MEALRMAAAGAQSVCCLESSLPARKSASAPSSGGAHLNQFSCGPLGLSGDGLNCGVRRSKRFSISASSSPSSSASSSSSSSSSSLPKASRVSRLASPPRSTAAAAPVAPVVQSFEGTSSLKDIDARDLEAETPLLLQQCSDLDWKKLVDDLRSEALHGLHSAGLRALSLKALEKLMESWLHEQMVEEIEVPTGRKYPTEEAGWSLEAATCDLRMEANLQAAQLLANGVDSSFDWEADVAELHRRILLQGGAESSVLRPEQRLWQAWHNVQEHLVVTPDMLAEEALSSSAVDVEGMMVGEKTDSLHRKPQAADEVVGSSADSRSIGSKAGKSLLSLGAAVATSIAVEGIWVMDAIADDGGFDALEAASRAPSWLVPAVLIFPPVSYFLFNVYRDQVNPYAKVTDWMFGVVAVTIVSNLVMMAVWGVRLY